MQDSVTVCGVIDPGYSRRLAEEAFRVRFQPGRLDGRVIVAPTLIFYDF